MGTGKHKTRGTKGQRPVRGWLQWPATCREDRARGQGMKSAFGRQNSWGGEAGGFRPGVCGGQVWGDCESGQGKPGRQCSPACGVLKGLAPRGRVALGWRGRDAEAGSGGGLVGWAVTS